MAQGKSAVIIGGGVAGIAAAVALSEAGLRVTLLEKRPMLGGRASSFFDRESGHNLDACQHGTMRCCTNLTALLTRLGAEHHIRYSKRLDFLDSEGRRSVIEAGAAPAPFHTALSFLRFRSLGMRDKFGIGRAMVEILRTPLTPDLDALDVAGWFAARRQTPLALSRFWRPVLISACNEELNRISCYHAFKLFRDGFLAHRDAYQFGIPDVSLGELYTEPTRDYLTARGGELRLRTIVDSLDADATAVRSIRLQNGEVLAADYFVSALQFDLMLKLVPDCILNANPTLRRAGEIHFSPIVGVHLWFDRDIDCPPALALLDRKTDWIFKKEGAFRGNDLAGAYLSMVISGSQEIAELPNDEIAALVESEVREALPDARNARVLRAKVLKERKATMSPHPGIESLRPGQTTTLPNLFVAGEWTDTGWPSTMEGAARSGFLAAEALLEAAGTPRSILAPDLPRSLLAQWVMRR